MAGPLAALLGALAAWVALVLVFAGVGLGLAVTWRTWGDRVPGSERLSALFQRRSGEPDAMEPADGSPLVEEWVEEEGVEEAGPVAPPVAAPAPASSAPMASMPAAPPAAAPVAGDWLDDHRAEGWQVVADGTHEGSAATDPWAAEPSSEPPVERPGSVQRAPLGPLVPTRRTIPVDQPMVGQGHPNDAALDAFDESPVDPERGTRVIPVTAPATTLGDPAELVEIDIEAPWTLEHPADAEPAAVPEDPFVARPTGASDNPFAARPDAPLDDVDLMLTSTTGPAEGPTGADPQAPPPGRNIVPIAPAPGPDASAPAGPAAPASTSAEPAASPTFAPPAPRERTLTRTEALEELTAIYTVSYEDACCLLDVGLWGFENHEEWIRAVRAGGRPAGVSEEVFQKVLSMPMRAIQADLDKLRAKRRATQELEKMWGVGAPEASALYDAGFTNMEEIREASVDQLARVPGINHSTAFMIKASAHGLAPDTQ